MKVQQIINNKLQPETNLIDVLSKVDIASKWRFIQAGTQESVEADFNTCIGYRFTVLFCSGFDNITSKLVFDCNYTDSRSIKEYICDYYELAPIKLFGNVVFMKTCEVE